MFKSVVPWLLVGSSRAASLVIGAILGLIFSFFSRFADY